MPKPLRIDQISRSFPKFIPGIGQNRLLRELADSLESKWINEINEDLIAIVEPDLTEKTFSNLVVSVLKPLRRFFEYVKQLPTSNVKLDLEKYVRFYALVIGNRLKSLNLDDQERVQELLNDILQEMGVVPRLNKTIRLPDGRHLPAKLNETKHKWSKIVYKTPSRYSKEEPVYFFEKHDEEGTISSARRHLIALEKHTKVKGEALSFADADFYMLGDLQADHLQPSDNIIARQKECVQAMNIDPIFAKEILQHPSSNDFFIYDKDDDLYFGTKYFYLLYHNCIDNLWLISTAANTGFGKGNSDPVEWLKMHPRFGDSFMHTIGGENSIQQSQILYETMNGEILAHAAKAWFAKAYRHEIVSNQFIRTEVVARSKARLSSVFSEPSSHHRKKLQLSYMANLSLTKCLFMAFSSTENDSQSSHPSITIPSEAASFREENMDAMYRIAEVHHQSLHALGKELVSQFRDQYTQTKTMGDS